jgi:hypothetical protein
MCRTRRSSPPFTLRVPCQSPEMSWARETDDAKTTSARVVKSLFILRKMESPLIHLETSNIETSFLLRN